MSSAVAKTVLCARVANASALPADTVVAGAKTTFCAPVAHVSSFSADSDVADVATSCVPDLSPVLVIEYIAPVPVVNYAASAPVFECIAPAPVVTHVAPAPKCIWPLIRRKCTMQPGNVGAHHPFQSKKSANPCSVKPVSRT